MSRAGQNAKSETLDGAKGTASHSRRRFGLAVPALLTVLLFTALAITPSGAAAATPEALWTRCTADTDSDTQCSSPRGIATAPASAGAGVAGNVFVADAFNRRIVEFTAWGQLVRTFGWGVVASGPDDKAQNEIQEVAVDATAGDFKLRLSNDFGGRDSAPIPFDASAAAVQAALEAIGPPVAPSPGVSPGDVSVNGPAAGPWTIEFTGALADADIRPLKIEGSTLSGGAGATVATTQGGANFEVCVPANGDTCRAGQGGSSAGQFGSFGASPQAVAVDSEGNVYVIDQGIPSNHRVQKFDPEGHFLRMWGKGVNSGTGANKEICTNAGAPTDVCGAGGEGTGPGQFGKWPFFGSFIAIDTLGTASAADDKVYVGDQERIQRFDASGEYQADLPNPEGLLSAKTVSSLAVVPSGNLFVAREETEGVLKLNATTGAKMCEATVSAPSAIAADAAGNAYVVSGVAGRPVRKFDSSCAEVSEEKTSPPFFPTFPFTTGFGESFGIATGSACLSAGYDLYVADSREAPNGLVRAYGPVPDEAHAALCPPPPHAPEVTAQATLVVESESAVVQGSINPKFWSDTSYYVQYASAECIEAEPLGWEAPCASETTPAQLGAGVTDAPAKTAKVHLASLSPSTEYLYRFVSESSGGGPVFGKDGTEAEEGEAGLFTTAATGSSPPQSDCPNQAFRSGASAFLPDCRAYEMVSPVDKNGGDIRNLSVEHYEQASPDGNRITYTATPAFGDQPSSKANNQYLASRLEGAGWSNHGINAPLGRQLSKVHTGRDVGLFSADLCNMWLLDENVPPLTPDALEGYRNLYRQDLCGAGGLEALTTTTPAPGADHVEYIGFDSVQGRSADSSRVFFNAKAELTPEAASTKNAQVYESYAGQLSLVSVLPGGVADPGSQSQGAVVGGGAEQVGVLGEESGVLAHAVSEDGSRVFWSSGAAGGSGKIYLREHPEQGIVTEECSEPSVACTIPVSSGGLGASTTFWGADPSGSAALYSEGSLGAGGTLYRFGVQGETRTPIVEGFLGVLGASEDLSRIYPISSKVLSGAQENAAGDQAQPGEPNLYLDQEGTMTFIATLLGGEEGDTGSSQTYRIGSSHPLYNAARVSTDGTHIAFQSRAPLTHYDNTDQKNGKADVEVFTYEAGGALACVSCNPSGARPSSGRELPRPYSPPEAQVVHTNVWAAAWIPTYEHPLYPSNVLSANGGRLFFNSYDALVRRDTNGAQDVYEWEAPGEGSCTKEDSAFHKANGGCLYLISSGEGPAESTFIDASPNGRDVFFITASGLLPQDPGHFDLYDARSGGGFPQPALPPDCEGEACQSAPAPPTDQTLSSASFKGAGNPKKAAKPRCAKGKRAVRRSGKVRCVARKHKHERAHKRDANDNRRAAR